jgi:hypothetical protein
MRLFACETTAAITIHARDATRIPPSFSGFASNNRPKALCGAIVAWDLRSPLKNVRCLDCLKKLADIDRAIST